MTQEHNIQNQIRAAVSEYCVIFRVNVCSGRTLDGRWITSGVPAGFSDLFGVRKSDGKAVFIEVKTPKGRASKAQLHFIEMMQKNGAIAGICRSAEDAVRLVTGVTILEEET